MVKLLKTLALSYWECINTYAAKALAAYKQRSTFSFLKNLLLTLLLEAVPIISAIFLLLAAYKWRRLLFALAIPPLILALLIASYRENHKESRMPQIDTTGDEIEIELIHQKGVEMQVYAISFMLRVLIAISTFTAVNRPRNERDIEVCTTDGASFYMKGAVIIYQAEVEVEGEITPEVEESLRREIQRYALKYVADYPMLISPEAGGRAPVEILGVKNCGNRVLIDYVFTSKESIPMIDARRRARLERQKRTERITQYFDEDYGE